MSAMGPLHHGVKSGGLGTEVVLVGAPLVPERVCSPCVLARFPCSDLCGASYQEQRSSWRSSPPKPGFGPASWWPVLPSSDL